MELKHFDLNAPFFEAMGVKYYPKMSLSVERYRWFEAYQNDFGWGMTFNELYQLLKKSVELGNKGKAIEAWNVILNIMEGVGKDLEKKVHPAFLICALFIVEDDEDLTQWDENKAKQKIDNWNKEGYDSNDFFRLAANLVSNYIEDLQEILEDFSELAEVRKKVSGKKESKKKS